MKTNKMCIGVNIIFNNSFYYLYSTDASQFCQLSESQRFVNSKYYD